MARNRVSITRNYYGAMIDRMEPATGLDQRVYFTDERGSGNALMNPRANPEHVRVGDTADVIRNGNGRILMLRRPDQEN